MCVCVCVCVCVFGGGEDLNQYAVSLHPELCLMHRWESVTATLITCPIVILYLVEPIDEEALFFVWGGGGGLGGGGLDLPLEPSV